MKSDVETLTRALAWVNARLNSEPGLEKFKAVDQAALKFNLGPLDTEWLMHQLREDKASG